MCWCGLSTSESESIRRSSAASGETRSVNYGVYPDLMTYLSLVSPRFLVALGFYTFSTSCFEYAVSAEYTGSIYIYAVMINIRRVVCAK